MRRGEKRTEKRWERREKGRDKRREEDREKGKEEKRDKEERNMVVDARADVRVLNKSGVQTCSFE